MTRRRPPITPPENIVAYYDDGTTVPLDSIYAGWREGAHVWLAIAHRADTPDRITVDRLPAWTAVYVVPPGVTHIPRGDEWETP